LTKKKETKPFSLGLMDPTVLQHIKIWVFSCNQ